MASNDINDYFPPLDPDQVRIQLSTRPFVQLEGVLNVRDLGGYPSTTHPESITKSSRLFRAGEVFRVTENGKTQIRSLGITKIFDLRSDAELRKFQAPLPVIDGVEVVSVPVFKEMDYSREGILKTHQRFADGTDKVIIQTCNFFSLGTSDGKNCNTAGIFNRVFGNARVRRGRFRSYSQAHQGLPE